MDYHFGIPAYVIHVGHLLMGLFFAYIGYYNKMNKQVATGLLILGALSMAYHSHLMFFAQSHIHMPQGVQMPKIPNNPQIEQAIQMNALQRT